MNTKLILKNKSVFTCRHGGHIGVPKQWNSGHVGVPNQSSGIELFSYAQALFCSLNLHRCRPREWKRSIECFHSRDQHLCKFIETRESVCIRKEINSQRILLGHQHGRRFIVLGHLHGRRDVMWKHSISGYANTENVFCCLNGRVCFRHVIGQFAVRNLLYGPKFLKKMLISEV